jgi:hypothetical protein
MRIGKDTSILIKIGQDGQSWSGETRPFLHPSSPTGATTYAAALNAGVKQRYFEPSTSTGSIEGGEENNSGAAAVNACPTGPLR